MSSHLWLLLGLIAFIALCPTLVRAEEEKKSDYGTVIGIGECLFPNLA